MENYNNVLMGSIVLDSACNTWSNSGDRFILKDLLTFIDDHNVDFKIGYLQEFIQRVSKFDGVWDDHGIERDRFCLALQNKIAMMRLADD